MRVMTIAASDPGLVHAALQERTVYVHLLQDLAIGVVKEFIEQCRRMGVVQRSAELVLACRQ